MQPDVPALSFKNLIYFQTAKDKNFFLKFAKICETKMMLGYPDISVSFLERWRFHKKSLGIAKNIKRISYERANERVRNARGVA